MLKHKKLVSMVMAVTLAFSLSGFSFASEVEFAEDVYAEDVYLEEENFDAYVEYLEEVTGISGDELKTLEKEEGNVADYLQVTLPEEIASVKAQLDLEVSYEEVEAPLANVDQIPGYFEAYSEYTGVSVEELKQTAEVHGDLGAYLGLPIDLDQLQDSVGEVELMSSGGGSNKSMTAKQWATMKSKADKGDTLVTKDSWTGPINHGHAAIVYQSSAKTVEHTGSGLSNVYDISRWSKKYTMRDYYPTGTTGTKRRAAADYAYNKLRSKKYDSIADVNSGTYVNCATLVWKAYKNQGITLKTVPFYVGSTKISDTVYPKTLVTSKMTLWAGVNWSGGKNSW